MKISFELSSVGRNFGNSEFHLNIDSVRNRQDNVAGTFSERIQYSLKMKSIKSGTSKKSKSANTLDNLNNQAKTFNCLICYLDVDIKEIMIIKCGHFFCKSCL